jgi:hypothetical protein
LLIDGTCTDPDYAESAFVITNTEQLTFQVPGGPLIPYTQVTGHFPATMTADTLPPGVRQSPTTFQQNDKPGIYVVRLTVNGQRDGLLNPADQTLLENFKEIRVVVQ